MRKRDSLWEELVQKLNLDLSQPVIHLTDARIESVLMGRMDLRVFLSMTTKKELAPVLDRAGVFVLPLSTAEWVLTHGEGYHDLEDPGSPQRFQSTLSVPLTTATYGKGENGQVLNAYNIGLLSYFTGDPTIRPTISGRSFTPKFEFHVDGFPDLAPNGAQIEVDQGFEGQAIQLYEAKRRKSASFITRQLYYPKRTFAIHQGTTGRAPKPIRSFFFVASRDGKTYNIWEYEWEREKDYQTILKKTSACFEIEERLPPKDNLASVSPEPSVPFFQADDPRKVLELPFLIPQGVDNASVWAAHYGLDSRQASYYRAAGEGFGLVKNEEGTYALTEKGKWFVTHSPKERNDYIAETLLKSIVFNKIAELTRVRGQDGVGDSDVARIIAENTNLTGSTLIRRASSVRSYFKWLAGATGSVVVEGRRIYSREAWERAHPSA